MPSSPPPHPRPLGEHPDAAAFRAGFHDDHIEAIGFLLGQRLVWLEDGDVPWRELCGEEPRRAAHLRALAVGGHIAAERIAAALADSDDDDRVRGAAYAATALTLDAGDAFAARTDDPEILATLADGVCAAPAAAAEALAGRLAEGPGPALAARVLTRIGGQHPHPALADLLQHEDLVVRADAAQALAIHRHPRAVIALRELATAEHPALDRILLALLAADHSAGQHATRAVLTDDRDDLLAACALAAVLADAARFLPRLWTLAPNHAAAIAALGHHGQAASLAALLPACALDQPAALREAAARAIECITGIPLLAADAELDDDEPTTLDLSAIEAWLTAHRDDTQRFRRGAPCSEAVLLDQLAAACGRRSERHANAHELAIRRGAVAFDPTGGVNGQEAAIAVWRRG